MRWTAAWPVVVLALVAGSAGCRDGAGSATPVSSPPPPAFTIAATGDVLVHRSVAEAATRRDGGGYDFGPLLAGVAGRLARADLAVCHLETPLAADGQGLRYGPVFSVPGEVAAALAGAGFDACSTASNHSLDGGEAGVRSTLGLLDDAGLAHTGTARDPSEAARPVLVDAGRARVALLSYTFGFNAPGGPPPAGREFLANLISEARIAGDARSARAAGADFVVVSLHWGTEYRTAPDDGQRALAGRLLASPAVDLILGTHPHVVGPVERYGAKVAVYSLGNFLSGQPPQCCPSPRDGMIVEVDVTRRDGRYEAGAVRVVPTLVEPETYRVRLAPAGSASFCATVAASGVGEPCGATKKPET